MSELNVRYKRRWSLSVMPPALLIVLFGLGGCSGQGDTPDRAAPAPASTQIRHPVTDTVLSPQVASMSVEQLHKAAAHALHDNRMYAPAGDNAVEYYLALRDKQPADASVSSTLTDLMPYTLIAAEQDIRRGEFTDTQRLIGLIERVDARTPALPRLKDELARRLEQAPMRTAQPGARTPMQTRPPPPPRTVQNTRTEPPTQQANGAGPQNADAAAEQPDTDAAAALQKPPSAPAVPSLRAIDTPAPRYPLDALRSRTAGEVLVEITVGTDGSVTGSRVLRATPPRVFDREALNAIKHWKFEPVAAPVTTRRTLSFNPGN